MSKVVGVRLSGDLYTALRDHARARGLEPSVAARDLIRRGLGAASPSESAMVEARIRARRELAAHIAGYDPEVES